MKIIDAIAQKSPFYSLEFFPPKDRAQWPEFFKTVDRLRVVDPLFVSVTYGAGGGTQDGTLDLTAAMAGEGLLPMAHLTCVGATADSIRAFLGRLEDAGVNNILALRGDPPKNGDVPRTGDFRYAADLARFVRRECPRFGIGVAAYLTPHPESASFAEDRANTLAKLEAGSDFAVTQLFFDAREYAEYVAQMRAIGMTRPIVPGVLPIQSLESIRKVLSLSGCNIPAKLYLAVEEADRAGGARAVREAGIAFAVEQIRRLLDAGAPGIHLYTLNRAETCLRIVEAVGPL